MSKFIIHAMTKIKESNRWSFETKLDFLIKWFDETRNRPNILLLKSKKYAVKPIQKIIPKGFIDEIGQATVRPLKYLFEPEELNQSTYIPFVTWQYISAMLGLYSANWPFYPAHRSTVDDASVINDIADFLEKINENNLSKLIRIQANGLKKYSKKELEHFLYGSSFTDDESDMIENLFFMNRDIFMKQPNLGQQLDKKIADYLFDNQQFIFIHPADWATWIKPYVDSIINYDERIQRRFSKHENGLSAYSLFSGANERIYQEFRPVFPAELGEKSINVGKFSTSKGMRIVAQFADGQQLIDSRTGEIIIEENNQLKNNNQRLWSIKDAPKWKAIDEYNSGLIIITNGH